MIAFVLKGLNLLLFLLLALNNGFLLLVELVDELLLMGALLLHLLDLRVLVSLLILDLGEAALALPHLAAKSSLVALSLLKTFLQGFNVLILSVDFPIENIYFLHQSRFDIIQFSNLV